MFILTIVTATVEIVYGIRAYSNSLIADGLYSFAEGLCLIGVILILHYSHKVGHRPKNNTFGYERLELLFGLIQEVFLLSVSLGVIVDAVNHLLNPMHVHDPKLMIVIGIGGMFVGILGMAMFWGYHHNHDIEEEIYEKKKRDILAWTKQRMKPMRTSSIKTHDNTAVEIQLMTNESRAEAIDQSDITSNIEITPEYVQQYPITGKEINTWLKYIDPLLTLIMVVIIVVRALPVIFSISEILIENVPGGIDTKQLMNEIVAATPAIKSIHSLHIWRATAKEIYATMHLVCDEDVMLSTCIHKYGKDIQNILKSYCIRYFTLQFEYIIPYYIDELPVYHCVHGLHRKRRGHTLEEPLTKLAKDALIHIR
ncbi:unnamed protein product [Rotaria sp. Silwood1]|nr:unnamed protein product [Rotaria sp. Silwood1]CAF3522019.1 unnamed protein product [Rotaria sp. Silwood1]CAF3631915.1 unnamed protein product [Rotaria sp. Silwood1]CAF3668586.1 unnamed protein product [Rotaria sp. Silwood1]CAF3702044.1 unnamed protein product [Rotaria sp. Silwood1]